MTSSNPVKVSVCMITYNHEKFIRQAIESALKQQTDFDYEIVIGEDHSTDATPLIIKNYRERYPSKIYPSFHEKNIGMMENFSRTFNACRGEYIALLDGDDYWTSPNKLQKQVNYLDIHMDCTICFHDVEIINDSESNKSTILSPFNQKRQYKLEEILESNFIPSCSAMFKKKIIGNLPDWLFTLKMADWPLYIFAAQKGNIGYLNEVLGVYRKHEGGVWSSLNRIQLLKARIAFYTSVNLHLDYRYNYIINPILLTHDYNLVLTYADSGDFITAKKIAINSIKKYPLKNISIKKLLTLLLIIIPLPAVYISVRWFYRNIFQKYVTCGHCF